MKHPLFIADNHFGSPKLHQPLETVIAVDHPPIKIIKVRGGKPATIEGHQGAQFGGQHRDGLEDHPFGTVAAGPKGLDNLEALGNLFTFGLAGSLLHLGPQVFPKLFQIDAGEHLANGFGAHAGAELAGELIHHFAILVLTKDLTVGQRAVALVENDISLKIKDLFQLLESQIDQGGNP